MFIDLWPNGVSHCYGLNCALTSQIHVKTLTPNVMVFADGVFGRKLGVCEFVMVGPT